MFTKSIKCDINRTFYLAHLVHLKYYISIKNFNKNYYMGVRDTNYTRISKVFNSEFKSKLKPIPGFKIFAIISPIIRARVVAISK